MNKLVLHHTYVDGSAFDISDSRNHGLPVDVVPGGGQFADALRFNGAGSRVNVAPSPSLRDLGAIRVRVVFFWDPRPGSARRHNLVEGFVSFALMIGPNGELAGTIVDADGNWSGPASPAGTVTPGAWHVADLIHDGISRCVLYLDGAQVATLSVRGPVRSVGNLGIAVGHWPDPPDVYTFDGYMAEVQLFKHDLATEIRRYLDPCCADVGALTEIAADLREEGWTSESIMAPVRELLDVAVEATARYRENAGPEADAAVLDSIDGMGAFMRGDREGYRQAVARAAARARRTMPASEAQPLVDRAEEIVARLPIGEDAARKLAPRLCWGHGIAEDLQELIERHLNPGRPRRPDRRDG